MTPNEVSMTSLTTLLEKHRAALSTEFRSAISSLEVKLDTVQTKVADHDHHLSDIDSALNEMNDRIQTLEATCAMLADSNAKLTAKAADLEARSRRSNIRIIGLPESVEEGRPTAFFAQLLQTVLGKEVLPSLPELDRAHRSLAEKPKEGEKPRAVIIRFHKYRVKETVIVEARKRRGTLLFNGSPIMIYEDYTPAVMEQRNAYKDVMAELYELGLKPSLAFPAKLRITSVNGKKIKLKSVKDAESYLAKFRPVQQTDAASG